MGSDGASLSPLQLMNCLAGIGEVNDVNGMDVIGSAAIFNDHCVVREVVAKPGLCAMLAVCIVSGEIKVAAVNVYSRFGSDMTLVLLVREEGGAVAKRWEGWQTHCRWSDGLQSP
jgi:hypothetical protein